MYQIPAPTQFSFRPEDWQKWMDRFERFRCASGLNTKQPEEQVNSFVYLMGAQAEEILASFNLDDTQIKDYDVVKSKFATHFIPTRNVIYERFKFYTRSQEEGETVEQYVTSLYTLVQTCEFPTPFRDEMLRDRIVCGIIDKKVSEHLQLDTKLTLEKAITTARQAETIKSQQRVFGSESTPSSGANRVAVSQRRKGMQPRNGYNSFRSEGKSAQCYWCGRQEKHAKSDCPAKDAICNRCKRPGHYAKSCKAKIRVNEIEDKKDEVRSDESGSESTFVGHLVDTYGGNSSNAVPKDRWKAKVLIGRIPLEFKIDTGADVTVVPNRIYQSKLKHLKMSRASRTIYGPDGGNLNVAGVLRVTLKNRKVSFDDKIYVVDNLQQALLSCTASEKLHLIQRYLKEPLLPSAFPERPWQTVGADLLKVSGSWFLIVADYHSRYMELAKLESLTSDAVILHMKSIFARHGIPEVVRSDNGTQFSDRIIDSKYRKFAALYKFSIVTSSPKHSQSNGFIESMVKNFKSHYKKSEKADPYLMLLALRSTPLENGLSPAEMLMGRRLRTPIPTVGVKLNPKGVDERALKLKENKRIEKQKFYFDRHHRARSLPTLEIGQHVWVSDMRTYGKVTDVHRAPRSYLVETPKGILRRNRSYLHPSPTPASYSFEENQHPKEEEPIDQPPDPPTPGDTRSGVRTTPTPAGAVQGPTKSLYKTRSGRTVRPPSRLIEQGS